MNIRNCDSQVLPLGEGKFEAESNTEQRSYLKPCSYCSSLPDTIANREDILIEILVRVPARPLVRFKCVSKHWRTLISNPKFCHRHTRRNPNSSISAVFTKSSTGFRFVPLDLDHDGRSTSNHGNQKLSGSARSGKPTCNPLNFASQDTVIIQSCNGLFLCCPNPPMINRPYYVLNPTTNQFRTLIPPAAAAATTHQCRVFGYALAFDPSRSPHYKVVFLWSISEPEDDYCPYFHIEIYSSETQSWRLLGSSFIRAANVSYDEGVYCNGAVHWVGMDREISYYHLDEEHVGFVNGSPMPSKKNLFWRYFWESHGGGHLHLIDIYRPGLTAFEVLEMGRDYSGWFVKYHVDLDPIFTAYPQLPWYFIVVLFIAREETEGEDSSSLLLHIPGKVISYNLRSYTFKSFELPPEAGGNDPCNRVGHQNYRYMESLACV